MNEDIISAVKNNFCIEDVTKEVFGYSNGQKTKQVREVIEGEGLDTSHFDNKRKNRKYKVIWRKCPVCGIQFKTPDGGKNERKTCSHECGNLYFSEKREKKSKGYKIGYCRDCGTKIVIKKRTDPKKAVCNYCRPPKIIRKCRGCGREIFEGNESGYCRYCVNKHTEISEKTRRKISEAQYRLIEEGKHKGWKSRKKLEPSYPESYFMEVLNNEGVTFDREVKIGRYFADFLLPNNTILEIDGSQHKRDEYRRESDKKKDEFLHSQGYKVLRIDWYDPAKSNRQKLYLQIDNFFDFFYSQFY